MAVRDASLSDVEAMVQLSEALRGRLAGYSPRFWRKADDAFVRQAAWFRILLGHDDTIVLVDEAGGGLRGFAIGRLTPAPPVYAPGGPVCLIDDFCVADEHAWTNVGHDLLSAVEVRAQHKGAVLSVVICAHLDERKREFLAQREFVVTSEWHVRALPAQDGTEPGHRR